MNDGRVPYEETAEAIREGFMAAREIQRKMVFGTVTVKKSTERPIKKKAWLYRIVEFLNKVIDMFVQAITEDFL